MRAPEREIKTLRRLLHKEQGALLHRLLESTVFVGIATASDLAKVRMMGIENEEHLRWLTEGLLDAGSAPGPAVVDSSTGDLHFQGLDYLLPRIRDKEKSLADEFRNQAGQFEEYVKAREFVSRIAQRHDQHAQVLAQLIQSHTRHSEPVPK